MREQHGPVTEAPDIAAILAEVFRRHFERCE